MNRPVLTLLTAAVVFASACTSSEPPAAAVAAEAAAPPAAAAAVPATNTPAADTPPPLTPAKYYRPVKGIASIEVIHGTAKRVGADMVTVVKIRNATTGRIDLLQIDEYWYDKDLKHVSGSMEKVRTPFNPGDIIEVTMRSPAKPNLYRSMLMFAHAHGKIEAKAVKAFEEPQ
jgi:hypothetical protein